MKIEKKNSMNRNSKNCLNFSEMNGIIIGMNRNSKNCLNESEMNGIYQLDMVVIW